MTKRKSKLSLKQKIINLLMTGWVLPVLIMTVLLATYVDHKSRAQVKESVGTSLKKAAEIYELELYTCEVASKNASYYSDIRDAYLQYQKDGDERILNNEVNKFISSEYKYNEIVKSSVLLFLGEDKNYFTYNNSADASYKDIEFFMANAKAEVEEVAKNLGTQTTLVCVEGRCYMVRNLVLQSFRPYAILVIEMNDKLLMSGFDSVWGFSDVLVEMEDSYMMGSPSSVPEDTQKKLAYQLEKEKRDNGENALALIRGQGKSYALYQTSAYGETIRFYVQLDNGILYRSEHMTWILFGLMVIFIIPLMMVIFRFFRKNVTTPIDVMISAYDEVGTQNYGYQIDGLAATREFFYMQKSFNQMSRQIKEQFDKIYEEEIALRDAKIMALQSQINPHFLNNTFEIINWEARLNGNIKVSKMIEALSTMLEATMNRRGESLHSLSEELSYVDAYAYIISERLGDKFTYTKEVDESLLSVKVPKLIIQPIVENAVEHGISEVSKGTIHLRLYQKEHYVFIEVRNDGTLTEQDKAKIHQLLNETIDPEKERSLNLGIRNVNNRLRLIYGDDCGLFIEDFEGEEKEGYTISTILLKDVPILEQ